MLEINKSIEQGFSGKPGGLYDILKQLQNVGIGVGGEVYFVDNNAGSDGPDDGKSWERPYKTLSYAITASNANIAASHHGWASRNAILIKADAMCEDLTVPPIKCDVIGVGSCDAEGKTRITGEHAWTGSGTVMSSGFYNLTFWNDAATAIFTVATPAGIYFGDCDFVAKEDAIHAIHITGATGHDFKVNNCRFINDEMNDPFDTAAILIATTTTFWNLEIKDSYVEGDIGIKIDATNLYNGWIDNCTVKAVGVTIDDDSADCVVTNNTCISEGNNGTIATVLDITVALAANNKITALTGGMKNCPPLAA